MKIIDKYDLAFFIGMVLVSAVLIIYANIAKAETTYYNQSGNQAVGQIYHEDGTTTMNYYTKTGPDTVVETNYDQYNGQQPADNK